MKFGDKLIELRRKKGYSQEELAEKLGVSRQSVSKWESNNTYPETDKIIQICNLFDCSMDDLINDKVTDVESTLRKNKNNVYRVWDSLLEFITKTINMFSKMRFIDGLKCVIEMIVLSFILILLGRILCSLASEIITSIFTFLSPEIKNTIREVLRSILYLLWFIISLITIIHTFKIRYLNYYDKESESLDNKFSKSKEKTNDNKDAKDNSSKKVVEKVVVRDERPFEFLGVLSHIVLIFIKFFVFWILFSLVFSTIALITGFVITLFLITTNTIFLWLSLLLIAGIVVSIQIIVILIKFIFDKKVKVVPNIIIFVSCIVLSGLSVGLLAVSIKNLDFVTDNSVLNIKSKEIKLNYKDNLVIISNGLGNINNYKYIIDNNIEADNIIVSKNIDSKYFELTNYDSTMDNMPIIHVRHEAKSNFKAYFDLLIDNLKENRIISLENYGNDSLIIKANEETINKLRDNQKKLYLVKEEINENEINVSTVLDKVYFKNGLNGEYYAFDDSIKYNEPNYICNKEIEKTEYGERIIYICDYTTE